MAVEYAPETDLDLSKLKLQGIVETSVEVPSRVLYESVLDVLASRVGGDRWKNWDDLKLSTRVGIMVTIGSSENRAWIDTVDCDETSHIYYINREVGEVDTYTLYEMDPNRDNNDSAVSNWGHLASARLLSLLSDANIHTPKEETDWQTV